MQSITHTLNPVNDIMYTSKKFLKIFQYTSINTSFTYATLLNVNKSSYCDSLLDEYLSSSACITDSINVFSTEFIAPIELTIELEIL